MKRIIFLFAILAIAFSKLTAQLPETSTAENPVWYYIQALGEGSRAGLVFTTVSGDTKVYGKTQIFSSNESETATQLWRFEKTGTQYRIINKSTNQQLDIAYSSSLSISHGKISETSAVTFSIEVQGDYYNIKSSAAATGGSSSNIYAHQASDYGSRNFVIQFESSSYNSTVNSMFSFIKADDMNEDDALPELSTAENPIWYHIQVLGEGDDRPDRVFTVEGTEVYGRFASSSIKPADVDPQLWRFEMEGSEYIAVNKLTDQKLDVIYAASPRNISILCVSDSPKGKWKLNRLSQQYYQFESTVSATGGNSTHIYAHQSNSSSGVRDFVVMLESSTWGFGANSSFRFLKYDDPSVEISDDDETTWYYIKNKQEEYVDKCITDITTGSDSDINFSLEDAEEKNEYQQWKLIRKTEDFGDERVHFVNKATGRIIQTNSIREGIFSYIQSTTTPSDSDGWILNYLGDKQYEIYGKEQDDVTRYLYVGNGDARYAEEYIGSSKDSGFAWEFILASDLIVSIPPVIEEETNVRVYSVDRRIVVEGTEDYTVWNTQGIRMPKDAQLSVGVYVVRMQNKAIKLLIK